MRHGQSHANVAGIVLSHLEDGKKVEYTLTPVGEEQARGSAIKSKERGELDENTIIVSSPFSRAMRTAEIAKEVLGIPSDIVVDDRLRERWFGDWEKTDNSAYEKVWVEDKVNPHHTTANVESAFTVQQRVLSLVDDLEKQYNAKTILLVSHGDALQILLTGFYQQSPSTHRDLPHLETAEVRRVVNPIYL